MSATAADGKLFDNLANKAMRAKMRAEMEHQTFEWENSAESRHAAECAHLPTESAIAQYGGMRPRPSPTP
jgi:hypothetical protein